MAAQQVAVAGTAAAAAAAVAAAEAAICFPFDVNGTMTGNRDSANSINCGPISFEGLERTSSGATSQCISASNTSTSPPLTPTTSSFSAFRPWLCSPSKNSTSPISQINFAGKGSFLFGLFKLLSHKNILDSLHIGGDIVKIKPALKLYYLDSYNCDCDAGTQIAKAAFQKLSKVLKLKYPRNREKQLHVTCHFLSCQGMGAWQCGCTDLF